MAGTKPGPTRRRSHLKPVQDAATSKHPPQPEGTRLTPGEPDEPDWGYLEPTCRKLRGEARKTCLIDHGRIRRAAAARWRLYVEELGVAGQLARVDIDVLKDAALLPARIDEFERRIALEGATVSGRNETGAGAVRHPLFVQVNQYRVAMNKARAELGLSPGAREGITPRLPGDGERGDGVWDA